MGLILPDKAAIKPDVFGQLERESYPGYVTWLVQSLKTVVLSMIDLMSFQKC